MSERDIHISIVSPVYRAENIIQELISEVVKNVSQITEKFEIILVNDSSPDNSWAVIQQQTKEDSRIVGLNLSRNFGQHVAITAGLSYARGEWVVVMDCDLQDRPDEIPNLYRKAQEGYQSVFAQRIVRHDSLFKRVSSTVFYKLFSYLTNTKQDASVANFGIYHSSVIASILEMKDQIRYFPTMVQWVGYDKAYLPVKHSERYEGSSSYNFRRLFRLALDSIVAFSDKPLRLTTQFGFLLSVISFFVGMYYLIGHIGGYIKVTGFASLIISIWFLSGIIIMILGIIGVYLGKTFENVKGRPLFVIKDEINV